MSLLEDVKDAISRDQKIQLQSGEVYKSSQFEEHGMSVDIDKETLRTPNYSPRVMFYKKGCNICPKWMKAIRRVNMRMRPKDRIAVVQKDGLHPANDQLNPKHAPEVYIDGLVIQGATSTEGQIGFLEGFLEDAIVVHRSTEAIDRAKRNYKG